MEENKEYTQDELDIIFSRFQRCCNCHIVKSKTSYYTSRTECKTCWNKYQVTRQKRIRIEQKSKDALLD